MIETKAEVETRDSIINRGVIVKDQRSLDVTLVGLVINQPEGASITPLFLFDSQPVEVTCDECPIPVC